MPAIVQLGFKLNQTAMSLSKVLENWSDYDDRKKKGEDSRYFACSEAWEVQYLIDRIRKVYPNLGTETIRRAIEQCCASVSAPRPRKDFVECVLKRLV